MGVDLSIVDLVHVEPILVGLNTVDTNVVDTILCRTYSVCRLDLILYGPFMRSPNSDIQYSTGCPICSGTWVGLTLIWVFHHLALPLLLHSYQLRQNRADSETLKNQVNPTHTTSKWVTLHLNHAPSLR